MVESAVRPKQRSERRLLNARHGGAKRFPCLELVPRLGEVLMSNGEVVTSNKLLH